MLHITDAVSGAAEVRVSLHVLLAVRCVCLKIEPFLHFVTTGNETAQSHSVSFWLTSNIKKKKSGKTSQNSTIILRIDEFSWIACREQAKPHCHPIFQALIESVVQRSWHDWRKWQWHDRALHGPIRWTNPGLLQNHWPPPPPSHFQGL